jgi:hypothetical protein
MLAISSLASFTPMRSSISRRAAGVIALYLIVSCPSS